MIIDLIKFKLINLNLKVGMFTERTCGHFYRRNMP
jgi:hypothetical protein